MPVPPVLAVDFDGVLVDALIECAAMTYYANAGIGAAVPPYAEAIKALPEWFVAVFRSVRPYCQTASDFMVAGHISAPISSLAEYRQLREAHVDVLAAAAERAETVRAQWRETSPREWLDSHQFVEEVAECLRSWPGPRWIVSAKDEDSIRVILREHGVEELIDTVAASCGSKVDPLREASQHRGVVFIDDNLGHVLAAGLVPGVLARWAGWGYASPEDRANARTLGIAPLGLSDLPTLADAVRAI